jgi:hypothetical protein
MRGLAGAVITTLFLAALTTPAQAGSITGEFWDVAGQTGNPPTSGSPALNPTGGSYLATVDSVIASRSADATFQSSGIAYPGPFAGGSVTQTLGSFLGADASTLNPMSLGSVQVLGTIFRLTGTVNLLAGNNTFNIFSDDGFRLSLGGAVVGTFDALRAPSSSIINYNSTGGAESFELIYFEAQQVAAALTASVNGNVIGPTPMPEPSTMLLFGSGLAGFSAWRYRKTVNA